MYISQFSVRQNLWLHLLRVFYLYYTRTKGKTIAKQI